MSIFRLSFFKITKMGAEWIKKGKSSENLILFVVFVYLCFNFLFANILSGNEQDILPLAKQAMDKAWIKNDWTLNLGSGYRRLFNILFGLLARFLSLPVVSIIGRLIIFFLFGYLFKEYARVFKLKYYLVLPFLFLYLRYNNIIAGEWILGGLETKVFSYFFVLLSLLFLMEKKYFRFFLFLGLGISFHVLIGIYGVLCFLMAITINLVSFKTDLRMFFRNAYVLPVTASFGIYSIIQNAASSLTHGLKETDYTVVFRNPSITTPLFWQGKWILRLVLTVSFLLAVFLISREKKIKICSFFGFSSILFFGIGLVLFKFDQIAYLKYFWFRFPDVILPLFSFMLFFVFMSRAADFLASQNVFRTKRLYIKVIVIEAMFIILSGLLLIQGGMKFVKSYVLLARQGEFFYLSDVEPDLKEALIWIRTNTPKESIFLTSPMIDKFRVATERAQFVSFKLYPVLGEFVPEWFRRIKLCNNNQDLKIFERGLKEIMDNNFYSMEENFIRKLTKDYGVDYYLAKSNMDYSFTRLYENKSYTLYNLKSYL